MKRRVLFSFLIIAMAMAAITGGTLAWFTAEAEVENTFTAGTVALGDIVVDYTNTITNWNPGDEEDLKYTITNTGTKTAYLRVQFVGGWYDDAEGETAVEGLDPVTLTPTLGDNWVEIDGWYYYTGEGTPELDANEVGSATFDLTVKFVGGGEINHLQGKFYLLTLTAESIQSTNLAVEDIVDGWGVQWIEGTWEETQ